MEGVKYEMIKIYLLAELFECLGSSPLPKSEVVILHSQGTTTRFETNRFNFRRLVISSSQRGRCPHYVAVAVARARDMYYRWTDYERWVEKELFFKLKLKLVDI